MEERNFLEKLVDISPGMEIWWDSSRKAGRHQPGYGNLVGFISCYFRKLV
jgi:hypothetical protein